MLKNALYVLSALLASTTVMAQCQNNACDLANSLYRECKYSNTNGVAFHHCLCTDKFLVNYDRCLRGYVCAWDGIGPQETDCIGIYCPGPFVGGFDAKKYCEGRPGTSLITHHEISTD